MNWCRSAAVSRWGNLEASGARLREVGATNKTTLDDYAAAICPETALILRVHQSNFYLGGFAELPPNNAIARIARRRRVPFVVDLGSGALSATETLGLSEHEPTPAETLKQGAELVCFSGDKLSGGPQAGIIAGKKRLVAALKREPIFRALRCDKMVLPRSKRRSISTSPKRPRKCQRSISSVCLTRG